MKYDVELAIRILFLDGDHLLPYLRSKCLPITLIFEEAEGLVSTDKGDTIVRSILLREYIRDFNFLIYYFEALGEDTLDMIIAIYF